MTSLDTMHPLIKIQVAVKGLTLVTGGQLLNLQLSLLLRSSKKLNQETLFFRYFEQKCSQLEKGKSNVQWTSRDPEQRSNHSATKRPVAQRTKVNLVQNKVIRKWGLINTKLNFIFN